MATPGGGYCSSPTEWKIQKKGFRNMRKAIGQVSYFPSFSIFLVHFQCVTDAPFQDLAFLSYYIVVFSFIRQSLFLYVLNPLGRRCGISPGKLDRFAEQTYAVIYFTWSGVLGLYTMYQYLPTWYFRTEYFWIGAPNSSAARYRQA